MRPNEKVMSVKSWIMVILIEMIPIINVIMTIVWLVSPNTNKNLKNIIKASLIMLIIWILLGFLFMPYLMANFGRGHMMNH